MQNIFDVDVPANMLIRLNNDIERKQKSLETL